MKTNFKVVLLVACLSFFSAASFANNVIKNQLTEAVITLDIQKETVKGVYKGHDDSGYIFSVIDKKGKESKVTFHKADDTVLKANDLGSETLIGVTFEITFEVTITQTIDSNGEAVKQEVRTIKALKESS